MPTVTLLSHTPEPERLVAAAARMCYSAADAATIWDGLTEEKTAGFLDMLTEIGHESPVEHASFTFAIEGVSRSLLAQITRHRIASFSVQSQRYVREKAFEYVLPPEIAAVPHQQAFDQLTEILTARHQEALEQQGMSPEEAAKAARKKAIEDARFVLPNACCTKMVMTMNVRSLYNFFRLRCCNRAQWEIREVARQMLLECRKAAPHLFAKAGPACLYGPCSEGKMCCGQMEEVRRLYR